MGRAILLVFLLLGALAAAAENQSQLTIGPLGLALPLGWKVSGSAQHPLAHGPAGETLIATYATLIPGAVSDPAAVADQTARGFARERMPALAEKNGKVLRPVTEANLPNGRTEFSAVSQGKRAFRDYFFLQYLLTSKNGMVYLTVEGYGEAEDAAKSFDTLLSGARWADDPPSPGSEAPPMVK